MGELPIQEGVLLPLLKSRYGDPARDLVNHMQWLTPAGVGIKAYGVSDGFLVQWVSATTREQYEAAFKTARDAIVKLAVARAENSDSFPFGSRPFGSVTLGDPPPDDAVLETDAGRYKRYSLEHRWCRQQGAYVVTDNNRVIHVSCHAKDPAALRSRWRTEYDKPAGGGGWLSPGGMAVFGDGSPMQWVLAATPGEFKDALADLGSAFDALRNAEMENMENAEVEDF